jgi:magnesium chelatase family protein
VLFADEFCEAPKSTLEALRGPLEDRKVTISRLKAKIVYPASFMLIAASNPCPCGYYGEGERCTCSVGVRAAYLSKLSGPIMDRIDIEIKYCEVL